MRRQYDRYQRGPYKGYLKKEVKAWHKALERIPEFTCVPGCHRCCKVLRREGFQVTVGDEKIMDIVTKHYRMDAPCGSFEEGSGCGTYEQRPLICVLYGVSELLPCRRGVVPDKMLTKEETIEIMQELWGKVPPGWVGSC